MKKLEVILSQAIDEDFLHRCLVQNVGQHYTKIVGVLGQGMTNPKMGDEVWPQLNNQYMIVADDEEVKIIHLVVETLRRDFPDEGIALFATPCEAL